MGNYAEATALDSERYLVLWSFANISRAFISLGQIAPVSETGNAFPNR